MQSFLSGFSGYLLSRMYFFMLLVFVMLSQVRIGCKELSKVVFTLFYKLMLLERVYIVFRFQHEMLNVVFVEIYGYVTGHAFDMG
jgi:hypothetical protein